MQSFCRLPESLGKKEKKKGARARGRKSFQEIVMMKKMIRWRQRNRKIAEEETYGKVSIIGKSGRKGDAN